MRQGGLLDGLRRAIGRTTEGAVTYRVTLERESNADRETYVKRAESLTDGLEASIRDAGAGSFESAEVARTADPYSRTMNAIAQEEQRIVDYRRWLSQYEERGAPLLSSLTVEGVKADLDEATRSLDSLCEDQQRMANTVAYTVSFEPKSPQTIEAITSEFARLNGLDGVEAVGLVSDAPADDPRNSISDRPKGT